MRALLAGLALALVLSATPSIANADDGDDQDVAEVTTDDPGIAKLHQAIDDMRDARMALKADCPDRSDAKCKAAFKKARAVFKEARQKAIAEHHQFKHEQKKAREAAKAKAKAAERAAKPSETPKSPKPSATPRG